MEGGLMFEILTIARTVGGSIKTMTEAADHTFLFDSAYARRAEKAGNKLVPVYTCLKRASNSPLNAIVPSTWDTV